MGREKSGKIIDDKMWTKTLNILNQAVKIGNVDAKL